VTFIYELDRYSVEIYWMYEKNFPRIVCRKLSHYSLQMSAFNNAWSLPVT